jgi:hypothetical protein
VIGETNTFVQINHSRAERAVDLLYAFKRRAELMMVVEIEKWPEVRSSLNYRTALRL